MGRPLPDTLSAGQARALRVFRDLYRKTGGPPSVRDVAGALGIGSMSAYRCLKYLARKRRLVHRPSAGQGGGHGFTLPEAVRK
jgi:LexA DNA binding domain-containing protein